MSFTSSVWECLLAHLLSLFSHKYFLSCYKKAMLKKKRKEKRLCYKSSTSFTLVCGFLVFWVFSSHLFYVPVIIHLYLMWPISVLFLDSIWNLFWQAQLLLMTSICEQVGNEKHFLSVFKIRKATLYCLLLYCSFTDTAWPVTVHVYQIQNSS